MASNGLDPESVLDAEIVDLEALLEDAQTEIERDLENAATKAAQAIAAAHAVGSADQEGRAFHLRGWARFGTGDMIGALEDQLAAVDLLTECDNEQGVGRCLHALGAMYDTIGEPSVALEHYEQAIEIQVRVGDKWGEARTRNGLAIIMGDAEQFEEANDAFHEVAARFEEAGDPWWALMARTNRCVGQLGQAQADVLSEQDAIDLCRDTLAECDEIVLLVGDLGESGRSVELYARQCRSRVLMELGRAQDSLDEAVTALPMANRAGDATIIVELEMSAARALEALGQPETVFDRLDRAEKLARSAGRDRHLAQSLELRADLCEARGDLQGALDAHRRFHELRTRARREAEEMRAKVIRSLLNAQQAEHELVLSRAEVGKLEAIGRERRRMVSVIAHELRNPITIILGLSSEMARSWHALGDQGEQLIGMIRDEAEDIAEIVEDLMATDSIAHGSLRVDVEPCSLQPMVQDVLARVQLGGKSAHVSGAASGIVDPVRFRQILRNLISNAVRYGGDEISVHLDESDESAVVEVRDNGLGVPDEDRSAIFEPYGRSSRDDHGTESVGLGLAVTRQLARLMGGEVVYDETERETVFRLTLPSAG